MTSPTKPRLTDALRVVSAAVGYAIVRVGRRLVGRRRCRSWGWRLEATIAAQRGAWSVMTSMGAVRWRRVGDHLSPLLSDGLETEPIAQGGADHPRGLWMLPPEDRGSVMLYIHGGGFVFGSLRTHGDLIVGSRERPRSRALALEYRLAPEHPFPAALDDVLAALSLPARQRREPGSIFLAGDSAGGKSRADDAAGSERSRRASPRSGRRDLPVGRPVLLGRKLRAQSRLRLRGARALPHGRRSLPRRHRLE